MNPRGSIVCPSRPMAVGGSDSAGRLPGIIVYIKAGSTRLTRKFHRFCEFNGVEARPVQERVEDERKEAFECVGSPESLAELIDHPAIAQWHYILNVRPPRFSNGEIRDKETRIRQNVNPPPANSLPATVHKNVRNMLRSRDEREIREERERLNRVRGEKSIYHADNVAVAKHKAERFILENPQFEASDIPALTKWFLTNVDGPKDRETLHG